MPPAPRFRTRAIARLSAETRFAPAAAQARMIADAERFIAQVDPLHGYAPSEVTARVTRYRPEHATDDDEVLAGGAVIADLAAFILHASAAAPLDGTARGGAMRVRALAGELGVDERTVARFRRDGLVLHHVRMADGRVHVGCFPDALARFRERNAARAARAARTGRIDAAARKDLVVRALAMLGTDTGPRTWSLHALATSLAPACGRSVRAVRTALAGDASVLLALEAAARRGTARRAPVRAGAAAGAAIERMLRDGATPAEAGAAHGVDPATAQRAGLRVRADALVAALAPYAVLEFPIFALPGAERSVLGPACVHHGLPVGAVRAQALAPAPAGRVRGTDPAFAQLVAHHFLAWRARGALAARPRSPGLAWMDDVERDLRWAHRLKRAIVQAALPPALAACVQRAGRPWAELAPRARAAWAAFAAAECVRAIDAVAAHAAPPGDELRPVRVAALGVERAIARAGPEYAPPPAGDDGIDLVLARCVPWWEWVPAGEGLGAEAALVARFGLDGHAPRTYAELASAWRVSAPTAVARVHAALRGN